MVRPMKILGKLFKAKKPKEPKKTFNPKVRQDGDKMSDKEKMDKGFNGKTYSINGIDYDF